MISLCSYPMCLMRRSFDGFGTPRLMLFNRLLFGVLIVFAGNRVCGVGNLRWITALSIWQLDRNLLESSRFARESFSSLCDIFLFFSRLICVVVVRILAQSGTNVSCGYASSCVIMEIPSGSLRLFFFCSCNRSADASFIGFLQLIA
jgi:hypothetical protein